MSIDFITGTIEHPLKQKLEPQTSNFEHQAGPRTSNPISHKY
jgi:hypothetical protein